MLIKNILELYCVYILVGYDIAWIIVDFWKFSLHNLHLAQ